MSRIERSKWNGAWEEKRSSAVGSNVSEHQSMNERALECVCMTPFGLPVDPDVYRMYARSSTGDGLTSAADTMRCRPPPEPVRSGGTARHDVGTDSAAARSLARASSARMARTEQSS